MISDARLTAAEFAATKLDLPEGGRWHELHAGNAVLMQAPDDVHGTIVLNLSRALAAWFRQRPEQSVGYACHDVGVHVENEPDTVYFPAISYFDSGTQFEQADNVIASRVPRLVVEVASANDRRQELRPRTLAYMKAGVEVVWVPDPSKREIQVIRKAAHTLALGQRQVLEGGSVLPGFEVSVAGVFAQPDWWQNHA